MLGYQIFSILNLLIDKIYENEFLKRNDHKSVLCNLSCESIRLNDMFNKDVNLSLSLQSTSLFCFV